MADTWLIAGITLMIATDILMCVVEDIQPCTTIRLSTTNLNPPLQRDDRMKRKLLSTLIVLLLTAGTGWADTNDDAYAAYKRGDYAEAVKLYRLSAAQENPKGQFGLGYMYATGRGVTQNFTEAVKLYRLAAAQGYVSAQSFLGNRYKERQGVAQDYAATVKWYRLAAEQGNADAQLNLGSIYRNGQGVTQNYAEAVKWYRLAAEQGNVDAQLNLGLMYRNGQGVTQDYVRAHMWFNLGATSGDADSVKNRDLTARKMTSQQITQAQIMARDCKQKNFKGCE